jgi:hypothetical protein
VSVPCIGRDPFCPCQDGDTCHYVDSGRTKAFPLPAASHPPARGLGHFVTRSSANDDVEGFADAFRAGFKEGLGLYGHALRVHAHPDRDCVTVCLGPKARIEVTGLEMLQAEDLYQAGKAKALALVGLL